MPPKNRGPPICRRCNQVGHSANMCTTEIAADTGGLPPPATPLPAHTVPFIDSHCHIDYLCESARVPNLGAFIARAGPQLPPTFCAAINTLCDSTAILSDSLSQRSDLISTHRGRVFLAVAVHPHNSRYMSDRIQAKIAELILDPEYGPAIVAHGEMGLDTDSAKKQGSSLDVQLAVFKQQAQFARNIAPQLPVQLHIRFGDDEANSILDMLPWDDLAALGGVHMHCWQDGSVQRMRAILEKFPPGKVVFGFTGGICGPAVQQKKMQQNQKHNGDDGDGEDKKEGDAEQSEEQETVFEYPCTKKLQRMLEFVPLQNFVLETDSPYMPPAPVRPPNQANGILLGGTVAQQKANNRGPPVFSHPGHIPYVAAAIASAKNISIDEVLRHALANTLRIYNKVQVPAEVLEIVKPLLAAPIAKIPPASVPAGATKKQHKNNNNGDDDGDAGDDNQAQPEGNGDKPATAAAAAAASAASDAPLIPVVFKDNTSKRGKNKNRGGGGDQQTKQRVEAAASTGNSTEKKNGDGDTGGMQKFPSLGDMYA